MSEGVETMTVDKWEQEYNTIARPEINHPDIEIKGKKYKDVTGDYVDCGIEYGGGKRGRINPLHTEKTGHSRSRDNRENKRISGTVTDPVREADKE